MDSGQSQEQANSQSRVVLDLVGLLDENREEIATAWAGAIREHLRDSGYGQYPLEQISTYNVYGIGLVKDLLVGKDIEAGQTLEGIADPGTELAEEGIPIHEVSEASWLFQNAIRPFLPHCFPPGSPAMQEAIARLERCARQLTLFVVEGYEARMKECLRAEQERTDLLLKMTRRAGSTLELRDVLLEAASGIADAAGMEHCVIYLLEEKGSSCALGAVTDGLPSSLAERLWSLVYRPVRLADTSLIKLVADEQRPLSFCDAQADGGAAGTAGRLWGARAVLAVPILLNGRLLAVAIVFSLDEERSVTSQQMKLISGLAKAVAPAIENARLYRKVEQLAVLEERSRLAQEIHDDLAQTLGAMKFRASLTIELLASEKWNQVQESVLELQDMIQAAYTEAREAIFNLRSITSLGKGGLQTLEEYLDNYRKHYGLDVELEADGEAVEALAGSTGVQVIRIVQEALSNVRKHGGTADARVEIRRDGAWVRVTVEDEGQGFDPAVASGEEGQHFGLQFMGERAAKAGGTLAIESRRGRGTRVILRVPYDREGELP